MSISAGRARSLAGRGPRENATRLRTRPVNNRPVILTSVSVWSTVVTTTRQVAGWRLAVAAAVVAALLMLALLVRLPTAVQLRDWAQAVGPWFPLAFLAAHIVVTVLPFPRTAFTLAAGLLFGPWLGVVLAVVASALSALAALLLMRAAGWQLSRLVRHRRVDALDARLRVRGWPAVVSLRLIPALPFSVINYAAAASAVRPLPYTMATLVSLLPGTAAVVILGDALSGYVSPLLYLVSLGTACVGVALLAHEMRLIRSHSRHRRATATAVAEPAEPAVTS